MSWSRLDDKFHSHPKAMAAGPALELWVMALSWCTAHSTNGEVPAAIPSRLVGGRAGAQAATLVKCGLWEKRKGGWAFHDYAEYNFTSDQVEERREQWRERQARHRHGKANRE